MIPGGTAAAALHGRYAAACLGVTVLAGVWLRVGMLRPEALVGFSFRNLVHAHSHLALFGWVTMAMFAVILSVAGRDEARWAPAHAHLVGIASAAAFVGFLGQGYAPATIAVSAAHVALWVAFTLGVWRRLASAGRVERRFFRASLAFLMAAGAGTIGTGLLSARATDPWTSRLAIELLLTPLIAGWLVLGAFGVAYGRISNPRLAPAVLALGAAGALPSGLLHIAATPPFPWIPWVGRAGMILVGIATLGFAADLLRDRGAAPFLRLAGAAALLKGLAEVTAGLGVAAHLLGSQHLVIAYLHLVLLGMVTSILADRLLARPDSVAPAVLHGVGLLLQLGALVTLGAPAWVTQATALGWGAERLLVVALAGGVMSAAALLLLATARGWKGASPIAATPLPTPRAQPLARRGARLR